MMMSREVHHRFLHLRKKLKNDDEPLGLLSYATPKEKKQRDDDELVENSSSTS